MLLLSLGSTPISCRLTELRPRILRFGRKSATRETTPQSWGMSVGRQYVRHPYPGRVPLPAISEPPNSSYRLPPVGCPPFWSRCQIIWHLSTDPPVEPRCLHPGFRVLSLRPGPPIRSTSQARSSHERWYRTRTQFRWMCCHGLVFGHQNFQAVKMHHTFGDCVEDVCNRTLITYRL